MKLDDLLQNTGGTLLMQIFPFTSAQSHERQTHSSGIHPSFTVAELVIVALARGKRGPTRAALLFTHLATQKLNLSVNLLSLHH